MAKQLITIEEIPNEIHDNALDLIGNEFKFDHVKGMAEWLKNSIDAYRRNEIKQEDQHVVFRFTDQGVTCPRVECIDFMGMTGVDIEKALKIWFDPNAAKRGKSMKMYGGHGNGGKFYMRQMFKESRFITYKQGLLNIFGFSENKKYGYAKGFKNKAMKPKEALQFAEVADLPIPTTLKEKILSGETGFTLVQGIRPEGVKTKFKITREIERLKNHPQSRRILQHANVGVIYNGHSMYALLKPDELTPLPSFEEPRIIYVPENLTTRNGSEKVVVNLANKKYPAGKLILRTASEAMSRGSKLGELNRIDILGEIGVIGSYQLPELGLTGWPHAAFIYGEFSPAHDGEASILEDPSNDCVSNDRSKLVVNDTTRALLEWIGLEIDCLANDIGALEREKAKANQKDINSKFNDILNEWKNKHMSKILSNIFGGGSGGGSGDAPPGPIPQTITAPPTGFDFRFPQAEIEVNTPARVTLKVSVPQCLPIGATIFFTSDSKKISLEESKKAIKSDSLKSTEDGQDVAFLNVGILGTEVDAEAIIKATAGKLSASMRLKVIPAQEKKSGKTFPRVLLSSHDKDPLELAQGGALMLTERDPVVYQRPQDVSANIFWINTSSPMASKIYDKFTFDSIQWRNFLFERYVDIFVKEAVHELEKKDFENFTADAVDQKISEVIRGVHQSAKDDLDQFLFEENYVAPNGQ